MVNVIIYLGKSHDPGNLVDVLLKKKLIAKATIDSDNVTYVLKDDEVSTETNTVITVQTKSLLFSQIEQLVAEMYGSSVPIFSLPITQANQQFDKMVRENTLRT
ncbi:MAG: divalent cation tolerance protein CutA [Flavobacteriia bacterium]|jgi:uncharacterized protein involved in tolerance to divalent cations|nr:divalent cation tolerance protein CutA [Cryomorphaceae bacterium]